MGSGRVSSAVPPPQPPPLREILASRARSHGNRTVAAFDDRDIGFRDLDVESRRIAAGLRRHGVGKGDPVLLVIGNRSEYLTAFFATAWLGAIAVPVNVALRGESLAHLLRTTAARVALVQDEFVDRVREAQGANAERMRVFVIGGRSGGAARPFVELLARDPVRPCAIERGDPCAILFTSGTTGPAKGVTMPHQQFSSVCWDAARDLGLDKDSVFYTFHPLYHLNGLVFGPLAALFAGARAVVRAEFPRELTLADLRRVKATHWCALPYLLRAMLAAPARPDDAANDLRFVLTLGLLEGETREFQDRFSCTLVTGYGLTETGMVCRLRPSPQGTSGKPGDRHEMRIVAADGSEAPAGEVGEVQVRARQAHDRMLGYYRMAEATTAAFDGEWFRTGDMGRFDGQGYFRFVDRLKDSLKRRGENISTFEVEQVLLGFPGVTAAAVVGVRPAPEAEEEVRAFIECSGGGLDFTELIAHCSRNLAYFMVPRYVDLKPDLPRTALGKIRKQELRTLPLSRATFDVRAAGIQLRR